MRWKTKPPDRPQAGDTRTIHVLLLLPRTVNGETRWMEWTRITQEAYLGAAVIGDRIIPNAAIRWRDVEWAD